ncbi:MAG TPA: Gfo/Idh/MocA family oxidoreductase [Anaerolineae bacterium]|nr:Gfo/Idh/MocA family oxidoreductase [Anaerolineae bacterium]HQH39470.1 Gfo/Idh/MocA family oxidoreductase [Anaerolineae bacterium]
MKLCMIGHRGGHDKFVWDGLARMPHVRVVGISAGTPEDDVAALQTHCEALGFTPEVFVDYRQMLDQLQPDVVSVCGPFELHAEMAAEALRRGIHVICEKPVALTLEQLAMLRTVYTAARTKFQGWYAGGLHFAAFMNLRYDPAFYTAWRAVRDGAIGKVRLINTQKSYKLGHREAYYQDRATYGGTIPWVGVHAFDWIYWFSGETFTSVYATHSAQDNQGNGSMEMSALCHVTLSHEVFASASIDFLRPATAPTHGDDRVRVMGTAGAIEVRGGQVYLINATTEGEVELPVACERQLFQDFVEHIEGQTTALLSADDVFAVTEACLLARQSADEGRVITFGG